MELVVLRVGSNGRWWWLKCWLLAAMF